ncbi:glucose-1-phosphate adenylyltransferase [Wenyingzhuangia sp. 2_MG-2023]|uniref:glucose-1-phosphate adenylyltransferase n=1 Tax=Wenyingzhuangia sp. 2_MG-2023 TaxID=3062639 RepID=UPI0026E46C7D|nr:glucose-1-phosphate adenylyltransferase [Wenyingzhuangia sp. 2_MG-2023]MDO6737587.1 glucose-1-phosphate adenylyltransferase [Wenyingzhuangia sp. 2_MG-2023]MDO6802424.1 glucose-1-phosphate adenylyltransferase [Wenyingzhuangia sp. 1_MG-2023]
MKKKVLGIILGGGQGSRLKPLTSTRSKPAVPIAGKYRLVDIPISNCLHSQIDRIFVLTQFNSASLNKHIKNTYTFGNFSGAFVDIIAAEQTPENDGWFQGTADAVRQSMQHFMAYEWDYALILSGDQLYQMDFNKMVKSHEKSGAEISIATLPVNAHDATGFGILKTNNANEITSFIEKPTHEQLADWTSEVRDEMKHQGREYLASMGIYIFNRELLKELMCDKETMDFGGEIIPQAIKTHKVVSYQYEGYWTDIGTIGSFFEANLGLTDDIPQFDLFDNDKNVLTRPRFLPPTKISGTTLEKTLIAEGGIISASRIERTIVGIRSRIGIGSTISNCYVMGNDKYEGAEEIEHKRNAGIPLKGIGERCYINNCIIDKNSAIGNDVKINGGNHLPDADTELYTVRNGIVVIKNGVVIPSGTTII